MTLGRLSPSLPWVQLDALPAWYFDTLSPFEQELYVMAALKRVVHVQAADGHSGCACDSRLLADAPLLHEHLTGAAFDDGTPRKPSTLFVFTEGGVWKACLGERNDCVNLWAEADTFFELLVRLEGRLADPNASWRAPAKSRRPRS